MLVSMFRNPFLILLRKIVHEAKTALLIVFALSIFESFLILYLGYAIGNLTTLLEANSSYSTEFVIFVFALFLKACVTYVWSFLSLKENKVFPIRIYDYFLNEVLFTESNSGRHHLGVGNIIELLFKEVPTVQRILVFQTQTALKNLAIVCVLSVYICYLSSFVFLAILVFLGLNILFNWYMSSQVRAVSKSLLRERVHVTDSLMEVIEAREEVVQYRLKDYFLKLYKATCEPLFLLIRRHSSLLAFGRTFVELINYLFAIVLLVYILSADLKLASNVSLVASVFFLKDPIMSLHEYLQQLYSSEPGIKDLGKLFVLTGARSLNDSKTYEGDLALELDAVSCQVKGDYIFKNLSHVFMSGLNLIHGRSGAGKTTLCRVLSDQLDCSDGKIKWYSQNGDTPTAIMANQSPVIFRRSTMFNIFLNHTNYERISRFRSMYKGLFPPDVEDASKLSGGEKQMLNILRALFFDPEVLVIDELSNNLSMDYTKLLVERIIQNRSCKITIIVSHRLIDYKYQSILNMDLFAYSKKIDQK